MLSRDILLVHTHAFATLAMVGLIWTIQVVHYPLFASVGEQEWPAYERSHMSRITFIVGPVMLVEAATAAALVILAPPGVPRWMLIVGLLLAAAVWVSTAVWQGPMHVRLAERFDTSLHRQLVLGNWVRTIIWTARGVLALAIVHAALSARTQGGTIS
ncbi:MAG: hypothetical protein AAGI30_13740 [Planctomycetota bacterium]